MDKTGWLSLGREFHFANGTRLGKGWIKCLNDVPTDCHLGRASSRRQELAGIGVQSGSHRRDPHPWRVWVHTDTCLAWLALAGSVSNRDEQEMSE